VGQKGVRVGEIISELFGEKIDIIQFEEEPTRFIASALAPAEGLRVTIDEKAKTARASVPEDQLSLAIGKEGQNVRLATRLTGYKIDIVGQGKVAELAKEELAETTEGSETEKAEKKEKPKKAKTASKTKAKKTSKSKENE
ncbi:MAG: KH domain-containing protein, partial [bacterium]|nr:KH domain-containing protein [bacterium]